jgi:hypothetical protein
MAEFNKSARRTRITIAKAAAAAALAGAAVAVAAPTALASGTSSQTYGCYSTWGNTGSNGHCQSVTKTGDFQNEAYCNTGLSDTSVWHYFKYGSSHSTWGYAECTFAVDRSWVNFKIHGS